MDFTRLLNRQIRKYFPEENIPEDFLPFLEAINNSYLHFEQDKKLIERSMELSSEELMQKNKRLEHNNQALDEFVYRVSHDLKVPATNIKSMLLLLNQKCTINEPIGNEILQRLVLASNTLDATIEDVLEMTRVEKLSKEDKIDNCLLDIINEIIALFDIKIKDQNISLHHDIDESITIYFQKENLKSILRNLISNSIKYQDVHKEECKINIVVSDNDEYICIAVKDNGIGIDLEKNGSRLFKMFSRFNSQVEGTGVGLYILKKIVESQNGLIEVHSKLGEGSTFSIYFKKQKTE